MDTGVIIDIGQSSLYTIIIVAAPVLLSGLITGLIVAIIQATTQIQEATLAFIPKILVVLISIGLFGPWMLSTMLNFVTNLFRSIPEYIG